MEINLKNLYSLQTNLDSDIAMRHHVTYESTFFKRLLAFIVELGEFANETRAFKYWSLKNPSPVETILEEYADGLHFILSLGVPLRPQKTIYSIIKNPRYNLIDVILDVYQEAVQLRNNYNIVQYEKTMQSYLNLIGYLDVQIEQVVNAYLSKLQVNYNRQYNKY